MKNLQILRDYELGLNDRLNNEIGIKHVDQQAVAKALTLLADSHSSKEEVLTALIGASNLDELDINQYFISLQYDVLLDTISSMSSGFIYVLVNKSMPGLLKIGFTTDSAYKRAKALSKPTGVPSEFRVLFSLPVIFCHQVEKNVHCDLAEYRSNKNREFFDCDPLMALDVIERNIDQINAGKKITKAAEFVGFSVLNYSHLKARVVCYKENPDSFFVPRTKRGF